ncbi:hypothetical protein ACL02S_22750 [Nocardia sp. 004]|uniref:hypothetical protein n=1 Tax=Nocardia sp. 004 TaxID=3385978 RepID=UPI0039A1B782
MSISAAVALGGCHPDTSTAPGAATQREPNTDVTSPPTTTPVERPVFVTEVDSVAALPMPPLPSIGTTTATLTITGGWTADIALSTEEVTCQTSVPAGDTWEYRAKSTDGLWFGVQLRKNPVTGTRHPYYTDFGFLFDDERTNSHRIEINPDNDSWSKTDFAVEVSEDKSSLVFTGRGTVIPKEYDDPHDRISVVAVSGSFSCTELTSLIKTGR